MWFRSAPIFSPVEIDYLKEHKDESINQLSVQLAKSRNAITNKLYELEHGKPKKGSITVKKTRIGRRKDLGITVRSSWEANVLRWLKHLNHEWQYEPKTFVFDKVKHGTVSYLPDVYDLTTGKYIEIKGQLLAKDRTRIRRFKKYFPIEYAKLEAICNKNTQADKFFQEMNIPILRYYNDLNKEFKSKISDWE